MLEHELIDFHAHLDLHRDMAAAYRRCDEIGCTTLAVTTTPKAYSRNAEFAARTENVRAAVGLHPQLVASRGGEIELFEEIAHKTRFIGEIGLDAGRAYYASFKQQKEAFERALRVCAALGRKIISIHSVRCAKQVLDHIEMTQVCEKNVVVLHWFSASLTEIKRAIELGCWFSVNEQMLKVNTGHNLIKLTPQDRILTETDSPFLEISGVPIQCGEVQGVLQRIAAAWEVDVSETRKRVAKNARSALS